MPDLSPQELEWLVREIGQWLDDVWQHLSPAQQEAARAAFEQARAALAQARAAAGSPEALDAVKAAMAALIRQLAAMGVRLTIYFQRLVDILGRFVTLFGEGGAAEGAAGTAGFVLVEFLLVFTLAFLAILMAKTTIENELAVRIEDQPGGVPCGLTTKDGLEMATVDRTLTVWAFGRRSALKKAFDEAARMCADDSAKCRGGCAKGKCKPSMSVQSFDLTWFFAVTRASVTFRCPCQCVED